MYPCSKGTLWIGEVRCHGGGGWSESSRTLSVKSLTSEQRNSCLFFQLLLLFFGERCLILLTKCSVTAQTSGQIKEEREGGGVGVGGEGVSKGKGWEGGWQETLFLQFLVLLLYEKKQNVDVDVDVKLNSVSCSTKKKRASAVRKEKLVTK